MPYCQSYQRWGRVFGLMYFDCSMGCRQTVLEVVDCWLGSLLVPEVAGCDRYLVHHLYFRPWTDYCFPANSVFPEGHFGVGSRLGSLPGGLLATGAEEGLRAEEGIHPYWGSLRAEAGSLDIHPVAGIEAARRRDGRLGGNPDCHHDTGEEEPLPCNRTVGFLRSWEEADFHGLEGAHLGKEEDGRPEEGRGSLARRAGC